MASKLQQITYKHCTMQKLIIRTGVLVGSVAGSSSGGHRGAGSRLQQCEEEQSEREIEREGPHSADQMTSLLQLMFSGAQTQG